MEEREGVNSLLLCFERPHNFGYWDQSLIDTFIGIVEMSTKGKTWPETLSLYIEGGRCLDFHIFIDETFVRHPPWWFSPFFVNYVKFTTARQRRDTAFLSLDFFRSVLWLNYFFLIENLKGLRRHKKLQTDATKTARQYWYRWRYFALDQL